MLGENCIHIRSEKYNKGKTKLHYRKTYQWKLLVLTSFNKPFVYAYTSTSQG